LDKFSPRFPHRSLKNKTTLLYAILEFNKKRFSLAKPDVRGGGFLKIENIGHSISFEFKQADFFRQKNPRISEPVESSGANSALPHRKN
jgi:hypothetical protein